MDAVILAAGEGKKLRPLTTGLPKVMLPVGNKPIIEYVINSLVKNNIRDITIVVGYYGEKIKRTLGDGREFGARIKYVIQNKQLGTAHALYQAKGIDEFIVIPGDNIVGGDCIAGIIKSPKNTILAVQGGRGSKYGVVEKVGRRLKIIEKPKNVDSSLIFTGVAHLDSTIFPKIHDMMREGVYSLPEVINTLNFSVLKSDCEWRDAMYPWDLLNLNSYVLGDSQRRIYGRIGNSTIIGAVMMQGPVKIAPGVHIKGPVVIGKNVEIGPNTVIMPDSSIGEGVKMGAFSYVENSIIMPGAILEEGVYIRNSVIGPGARINARTSILSGKFERILNGEVLNNFGGAIVGARAEIGAHCVVAPGILIGSDSEIDPLKNIKSDVANGERVR